MFERIKYAALNFVVSIFFLWFFCFKIKMNLSLFLVVILFVALADVAFVNGLKYGCCAYGYLILNRGAGIVVVLVLSILAKEHFFWFWGVVYCLGILPLILNQWKMIGIDVTVKRMQQNYLYTVYELHCLLSKEQRNMLKNLESIVSEDKMYVFIATVHPQEIKKLLSVDLRELAFLIEDGDYEKIERLAKNIK